MSDEEISGVAFTSYKMPRRQGLHFRHREGATIYHFMLRHVVADLPPIRRHDDFRQPPPILSPDSAHTA